MEMYRSFFPAFIVMYQQLLGDGYMEDMQKSRFAIGTLFYLVLSVIGALILTNVLIGVVCVVYEERAEAADEDWRREINSLMGDAFLAESSWNKLTERKTSKWWRRFFKKATRVVHNIMRRKPVFDDDDDEEEALVRLRGNSNASRFAPALIAFLEEQADGGGGGCGGGGGSGGATSDGTGSRTGERTNNRTSSGAVVSRSSNKVVPILPDDGSESRPSNGKAATNSTPEPKSASDFRACLKTLQSHAEYQHSGANPSVVHRDLILRDDSSNLFRFDHWSKKSKQAAQMDAQHADTPILAPLHPLAVIEAEQQAASLSSTTVVVKETSLAEETVKEGVQKGLKQLQLQVHSSAGGGISSMTDTQIDEELLGWMKDLRIKSADAQRYFESMDKDGYDDKELLRAMSLQELQVELGIKKGHAIKMINALKAESGNKQ
jgi:hypothetical protein